jgi:aspartate-semialdehyde dehydrogenase
MTKKDASIQTSEEEHKVQFVHAMAAAIIDGFSLWRPRPRAVLVRPEVNYVTMGQVIFRALKFYHANSSSILMCLHGLVQQAHSKIS